MFYPSLRAMNVSLACYLGPVPRTCLRFWLMAANIFTWIIIFFAIYRLAF